MADQEQAGAFFVLRGIEDDEATRTVVAGAGIFGGYVDRAAVKFGASGGVEGVQALVIITGTIFRHGHDVDNWMARLWPEDHGSRGDSNFGADLAASANVGGGLAGF